MKKLSLLFAAVAFSMSMLAETATLTITSAVETAPATLTDDADNSWAFTTDGTLTKQDGFIQAGTNKLEVTYIQLVSTGFEGKTIEKVTVTTGAKKGTGAKAVVLIGDTKLGESKELENNVSSGSGAGDAFDFENTDAASGEVTIRIEKEKSTGALYFLSAVVEYTEGEVTPVATTEISLDATATVAVGANVTLKATRNTGANDAITWKSADEKIATVNAKGVVTGVAEGKVNITATANDKTATCEVTVTAKEEGKDEGGNDNKETTVLKPSEAAKLVKDNGDKDVTGTFVIEGYAVGAYSYENKSGTVSGEYDAEKDFQSFWMADEKGGTRVFVAYHATGVKSTVKTGSKVRVESDKLTVYNGTYETASKATTTVTVLEEGEGGGENPTPSTGEKYNITPNYAALVFYDQVNEWNLYLGEYKDLEDENADADRAVDFWFSESITAMPNGNFTEKDLDIEYSYFTVALSATDTLESNYIKTLSMSLKVENLEDVKLTNGTTAQAGDLTVAITAVDEDGVQFEVSKITLEVIVVYMTANALEHIEIDPLNLNAPMYNIQGIQVDATYKGIVIQNGHKYLLQ